MTVFVQTGWTGGAILVPARNPAATVGPGHGLSARLRIQADIARASSMETC